VLATYKLTDNKPQPLLRVKLSVGREGMLDIALAGAGQLAFVSADPIVRFYNLQSDDNYVRPPPTAADRRRASPPIHIHPTPPPPPRRRRRRTRVAPSQARLADARVGRSAGALPRGRAGDGGANL